MKIRFNVLDFNHNQLSTLWIFIFINFYKIVQSNKVIKLDLSDHLNETLLPIDYKIIQVNTKSPVSLHVESNRAQILQSRFSSPSIFNENYSRQKLFNIKLMLHFEHEVQLDDGYLFHGFVKPLMMKISEIMGKVGISVGLHGYNYKVATNSIKYNYDLRRYRSTAFKNLTLLLLKLFKKQSNDYYFVDTICTEDYSNGIVNVNLTNIIQSTAAVLKALGHLIGLYGNEKTRCNDCTSCIMHTSFYPYNDFDWFKCSTATLQTLFTAGKIECLLDPIPYDYLIKYCGNGVIDSDIGETCDCGQLDCGPCCQSCHLTAHATCGSGPCCDTTTCTPFAASENIMCRNNVTECDLPEYCDGKSAQCPENVYIHDGTPCSLDGYCYQGFCRSRRLSCKSIFLSNAIEGDLSTCGIINECDKLICNTSLPARLRFMSPYSFAQAPNRCTKLLPFTNVTFLRNLIYVADGSPCNTQSLCINKICKPLDAVLAINACPANCIGDGVCDKLGRCITKSHSRDDSGFISSWIDLIVYIGLLTFIIHLVIVVHLWLKSRGFFKTPKKTDLNDRKSRSSAKLKPRSLNLPHKSMQSVSELTLSKSVPRSLKRKGTSSTSYPVMMRKTEVLPTSSKMQSGRIHGKRRLSHKP